MIDPAAELTLHIARFLQTPEDPPQSPAYWLLVPGMRRKTYVQACEHLTALAKPVVVAPLQEPGTLGLWPYAELEATDRPRVDSDVKNQCDFLEESLSHCSATTDAMVVFETNADSLTISVAELRLWAAQYRVACGWALDVGPAADAPIRFEVRRPDGRWSLGTHCSTGAG